MSIMYLYSCQPLVSTLALETIATDQTHLRHLLLPPSFFPSPSMHSSPIWSLCFPGLPGCLLLLLKLLPLSVSSSPESLSLLNYLLLVAEVQVSKTLNFVGSLSDKRDASFTEAREASNLY